LLMLIRFTPEELTPFTEEESNPFKKESELLLII
jgi:hypothetical protein